MHFTKEFGSRGAEENLIMRDFRPSNGNKFAFLSKFTSTASITQLISEHFNLQLSQISSPLSKFNCLLKNHLSITNEYLFKIVLNYSKNMRKSIKSFRNWYKIVLNYDKFIPHCQKSMGWMFRWWLLVELNLKIN